MIICVLSQERILLVTNFWSSTDDGTTIPRPWRYYHVPLKPVANTTTVVCSISAIIKSDLGAAGLVEEKKLSGHEMIYVPGCKNTRTVSIIIRGGSEHMIDDLERGMRDALMVVGEVVKNKKDVAGGGAPETEISLQLRSYALMAGGLIQLAINAFVAALVLLHLRSSRDPLLKMPGSIPST